MQINSLQEKTIVDKKEELRVQEGDSDSVVSYICDVNGWSFFKNSFLLLKKLLQGDPDSSLKSQDSNNSEHLGHASFQSTATLRDGAIPEIFTQAFS